jgi:Flp pilus assembly protein TadG
MIRLGRNRETVGAGLRPAPTARGAGRDSRGAVQIEFILTIMTIMFVMFWMWELIMMTYVMNVLSDAAKEGVRVAIVQGSSTGDCSVLVPAVTARVKAFAGMSLHDMSGMNVYVCSYADGDTTTTCSSDSATLCSATNRLRVVVSYPFIPYINLPLKYTLHAVAEGRIVFNPS